MAPKADKKPAEKKPAEETKTAVAEKAQAEKKPKAGKKLPKEGGAVAGDRKNKRVKKSVETYKIYIFKVLKQKMSTGELLDIEPLELKFPFELQKQISSSLQLSNKTESYVAFKVKTTNPKKYCVHPNTVTMQAQKEAPLDMQCKDKFLLQSVVKSNGVTAKDITPEMFSKEAGHVVEECKLRVVYVSPPQPPSPVAEGSEEGSSPRASHTDNNGNANSSEVTRAFVDTDDKSSELHIFITSAPKADKKPAEKKPAKEKKIAVAEKATAEKKPKAEKKLPKEGGAVAGDKKKRVKKSVKTYNIYIFKVLKQKMSTGELLDIEPLELKFPFELQKQISSSLQLSNKTESYVAFKVKTMNPKKYCVRPNTVTMQAQKEAPPDMQCKDKFLRQSVVTSNRVTAKDITPEMFSKEAGHVVEEFKLRVVYLSPPQPPSPVAEGSEEGSLPRASHMDNNRNANSSELHIFITSAPKVDKKPAEKKPAKEKKIAVAEKATAEKKPKAGKKLPKEGGAVAEDKKKKRVKKSVETYKIYIFKKMSTGELIDIEPLELKFPFELHKQISSSLQLSNKTESYVAFEVKTTNPKKYCVRPNTGVVLPRSTCDVIVTMQAQKEAPPDMQCKDKFLLQSVVTSNGVTAKDITPEMFSKEAGHVVEECKLRVVYVSPPQQPSPVAEGSEEGSTPRASHMDNNGNANSSEVTRAFVATHDKSSELHEGVKKSGIMGFWESLFGRT